MVNLDLSGITLDYSDDDTKTGNRMTLDQSGDEHPIIEEVGLSPTQTESFRKAYRKGTNA